MSGANNSQLQKRKSSKRKSLKKNPQKRRKSRKKPTLRLRLKMIPRMRNRHPLSSKHLKSPASVMLYNNPPSLLAIGYRLEPNLQPREPHDTLISRQLLVRVPLRLSLNRSTRRLANSSPVVPTQVDWSDAMLSERKWLPSLAIVSSLRRAAAFMSVAPQALARAL
jgi:hypothetical protein